MTESLAAPLLADGDPFDLGGTASPLAFVPTETGGTDRLTVDVGDEVRRVRVLSVEFSVLGNPCSYINTSRRTESASSSSSPFSTRRISMRNLSASPLLTPAVAP